MGVQGGIRDNNSLKTSHVESLIDPEFYSCSGECSLVVDLWYKSSRDAASVEIQELTHCVFLFLRSNTFVLLTMNQSVQVVVASRQWQFLERGQTVWGRPASRFPYVAEYFDTRLPSTFWTEIFDSCTCMCPGHPSVFWLCCLAVWICIPVLYWVKPLSAMRRHLSRRVFCLLYVWLFHKYSMQ